MFRSLLAVLLVTASLKSALAADPIEGTMIPLPAPRGWVMLPDGVTLIVSQPNKGQLVFFDTIEEKETHRWELDFKPMAMVVQGDTLFVGVQGASVVHALDLKSGQSKREILLGGDAVANLACHPSKGLIYASTETLQIYSIDPRDGSATKTNAMGNFLVIDPVNASAVFTGTSPPRDEEEIIIKGLPGNRIKIYWDQWGTRAFILKYAVEGRNLRLVSSQKNAAVNAYTLNITPDGKKVMMTSGGGWRPPVEGGTGGGYICAAFSSDNLDSRVGEAPSGTNMAFHPVLNLAVLNHAGRDIEFFNPKSLVGMKKFSVAPGADARPFLITFGGKGTKVILWNGDNTANPREGLHFLPIELTNAERAELQKAYGKLPTATKAAPKPPVAEKNKKDPPRTASASKTESKPDPSLPKTIKPEIDDTPQMASGVIAIAGFNDAKGLNSNSKANAPYALGSENTAGGINERGWQGPWTSSPKVSFVKDVVSEGDGAVHLMPTINFGRFLAKAQTKTFVVETMAYCPSNGGTQCYLWQEGYTSTGPMWRISKGKISALDGNGQGTGTSIPVGECKPDTWCKIRVTIDTARQRWKMSVDGIQNDKDFGFRYKPTSLKGINFLVEGDEEIYLDAIRILEENHKD